MTDEARAEISAAAAEVWAAAERLEALIAAQCAGPHRYVQHRDRRGPWCRVCGYGEDGYQVRTALPAARLAAEQSTEVS